MITAAIIIGLVVILYWLYMSPFSQVFGRFPYKASTTKKAIALTFDDGPNEPFTSQLLDYLDEQKVRATFFVVGDCASKYPEVVKRIIKAGHVVGNHSQSHKFGKYFSQPGFAHEIAMAQTTISELIGKTPALFRPPWLLRQPWLLKTAKQAGLQVVSGEFCSALEVMQVDGAKIAHATLSKVHPGSIIIFHDGFDARGGNRAQTIAAVKQIIPELKKTGYSFVTVDELLNVPAYQKVVE